MANIVFNDIAEYLQNGREIEFSYKGTQYSITNHSGFWQLCNDTEHALIEIICPFEEKEILISKISATVIGGSTIQQIFDNQEYDAEKICIF